MQAKVLTKDEARRIAVKCGPPAATAGEGGLKAPMQRATRWGSNPGRPLALGLESESAGSEAGHRAKWLGAVLP